MGSFLYPFGWLVRWLGRGGSARAVYQSAGWAANFNFHPDGLTHWLPNELVNGGAAAAACERVTLGLRNGLVGFPN